MQHSLNIGFVFIIYTCLLSCCQSEPMINNTEAGFKQYSDSVLMLDSLALAMMNSDPLKAREYATIAVSVAAMIKPDEELVKALNNKGLVLLVIHDDSARYYFHRALTLTDTCGFRKERASIFHNMAQQYFEANDNENAIILLDSSIQSGYLYNRPAAIASSLIALAAVYQATDDLTMAKSIYDSALLIAKRYNLAYETGLALGNLARFQENTAASIKMIKQAIDLLESLKGTEKEIADFLVNLGLLQENPDSSNFYYLEALAMAKRYSFTKTMIAAYNNMAYVYLDRHQLEAATECIYKKAIPLALKIENYDWLSTLYDTYADIQIEKKAYDEAVVWLRKSTEARAVSDRMIAKKQLRLLNAVLDVKNKNLVILEKERQLILRNAWIDRMKLWLAIAGVLILVSAFGFFWIRQRNRNRFQTLKLESARKIIEAEEHEKEKNAMDLHDAIGMLCLKVNGAINQLPAGDDNLKQEINEYINVFSNDIRGISHRMSAKILERHPIGQLLKNLCQETARIGRMKLTYNIGDPETVLPVQTAIHIFRIVQELLNNSRKYASQANIELSIGFQRESFVIVYTDDGTGFIPDEKMETGMGLSNIYARANMFNGSVELDSVPGHGVYWRITGHF